eukprot:396161-Prorocentrum_minimum.AAC.6
MPPLQAITQAEAILKSNNARIKVDWTGPVEMLTLANSSLAEVLSGVRLTPHVRGGGCTCADEGTFLGLANGSAREDVPWTGQQERKIERGLEGVCRGSGGGMVLGNHCLLYTSDAADDTPCVDLG